MSVVEVFCHDCKAVHPHAAADGAAVCTGCGLVRSVDDVALISLAAMQAAEVQDMRFCPWCRATLPADHACPAGAVGCIERPGGETPCGGCAACIAAMTEDLVRRGHPADLDGGA